MEDGIETQELLSILHEADGYLSLIGYRYRHALEQVLGAQDGGELAEELKNSSWRCRSMAKRIEQLSSD